MTCLGLASNRTGFDHFKRRPFAFGIADFLNLCGLFHRLKFAKAATDAFFQPARHRLCSMRMVSTLHNWLVEVR